MCVYVFNWIYFSEVQFVILWFFLLSFSSRWPSSPLLCTTNRLHPNRIRISSQPIPSIHHSHSHAPHILSTDTECLHAPVLSYAIYASAQQSINCCSEPMAISTCFIVYKFQVYSHDTGRVKIKISETAKPKTPILVTRTPSNAGDNTYVNEINP